MVERVAEPPAHPQVLGRGEHREQRLGGVARVQRAAPPRAAGSRGASCRARVRPVGSLHGRRGRDHQLGVRLQQVEEALAERVQALRGRHARAERRRPGDQRVLEVACVCSSSSAKREPGPVAEAPVERAGADARGAGRRRPSRRRRCPALGDERARRGEDPLAVARRVGPLAWPRLGRLSGSSNISAQPRPEP